MNEEKLWMFRHKYYDSTGKRKEKKKSGFETEKAAIRSLFEVKAAVLNGNVRQLDHEKLTVGEWLDIWFELNKNQWKITTIVTRERIIRLYLKPMLGRYNLQKLDKTTYKRSFINPLMSKLKPRTLKSMHDIFRIAINAAIDDEVLDRNRFLKISIHDETLQADKELNYFSPEELNVFLKHAKENSSYTIYMVLLALSYSGMRKGEALGLQWKHIDFEHNIFRVEQTRDQHGTRTPKTKNSYRNIFMDENVIREVKSYRTWCKQKMLASGMKWNENSYVFISNETSYPLNGMALQKPMNRIIKQLSLPKVSPHGLRHTHCTILLMNNVNVKVIAERLGNTPLMIYGTYGHVLKDMEKKSAAVFSEALGATGAEIGAN